MLLRIQELGYCSWCKLRHNTQYLQLAFSTPFLLCLFSTASVHLSGHRKVHRIRRPGQWSETEILWGGGGEGRGGGSEGFTWSFVYTLVCICQLKPEVRTWVRLERRDKVSTEANFVRFARLLRTFCDGFFLSWCYFLWSSKLTTVSTNVCVTLAEAIDDHEKERFQHKMAFGDDLPVKSKPAPSRPRPPSPEIDRFDEGEYLWTALVSGYLFSMLLS